MDGEGCGVTVRQDLLRVSAQVADLDADVADPLAQDRLRSVTDALAHAVVDLADGVCDARMAVPWPVRPTTRRPPRAAATAADPASCSAMAARLHQVVPALLGRSATPLGARVLEAAEQLAAALQRFSQDVATARAAGSEEPLPPAVTTRLQRDLRAVHEVLLPRSPTGDGPAFRTTADGRTTVHP